MFACYWKCSRITLTRSFETLWPLLTEIHQQPLSPHEGECNGHNSHETGRFSHTTSGVTIWNKTSSTFTNYDQIYLCLLLQQRTLAAVTFRENITLSLKSSPLVQLYNTSRFFRHKNHYITTNNKEERLPLTNSAVTYSNLRDCQKTIENIPASKINLNPLNPGPAQSMPRYSLLNYLFRTRDVSPTQTKGKHNIVATSPVVLRWLCDSPRTGCAGK